MGLSKDKFKYQHKTVNIANLLGGGPVACFTSVAVDLNSGIPRTNRSDQGESWTRSLWITRLAL